MTAGSPATGPDTGGTERDPDGQIRTEVRGHVLLIGIDRVEKRNGFTPKMFRELGAAYTRLHQTPELFVGVLHAYGDHFSGGVDLPKIAELRAQGVPYVPLNLVDPGQLREPFLTKPVVAAMQGICFTIALELALASDVVVAAEDCRFAQLEVKRGILASYGGPFRLVARGGWGNAMRWLLTGDEFGAEEAFRIGLVQEVVPAGQQLERALELAERIARQAPLAVQATIENARLSLGHAWIAAADHAEAKGTWLHTTDDAAEGRRSFLEKRDATFEGR